MGSEPTGLDPLRAAVKDSEVPLTHFMPTHVTRNMTLLDDTIAWVKEGGLGDITAHDDTWQCLAHVAESGADLSHICFSSDGNGSMPKFDDKINLIGMGVGDPASILEAVGDCIRHEVIAPEKIFACASTNPAFWLGLPAKGRIEKGYDADIMVLDGDYKLRTLVARGRVMMRDGAVLVKGTFE
ncbi:MAG: amidohydrolase family protein, partial [Pyramidobacter sp.]|nr:amidohydrolase family protein [Pyramidobacter sp.]